MFYLIYSTTYHLSHLLWPQKIDNEIKSRDQCNTQKDRIQDKHNHIHLILITKICVCVKVDNNNTTNERKQLRDKWRHLVTIFLFNM